MPKSDVNGDGYPELIIGRIPAHSVNDVLAYGSKAVEYLQSTGGSWTDDISILINKWDVWGNDGSLAETFGLDLLNYLPESYSKHLLRNDCPECCDCGSYAVRESKACGEFNQGRALIASIGSGAHYYDMNFWFEVASGFDITKLDPNHIYPFLLGISCDLGAFEKTESPQWGRPICERLLFDDDRGIIGMFAPTRGSWQTGNYLIGKLVLENLYTYGAPSLGHACTLAQRDLIIQHPRYSDLAESYVFLGDPALQLFGSVITSSTPPLCNITVDYAENDFLFACPAGDAQELQADLVFTYNFGDPHDISKEDISLRYSQDEGSFVIFQNGEINAQEDAGAPDYTTTLKHAYFGGCGCDTVSIAVDDRPVGSALVKIKTCDLDGSGKVELGDLAVFGESYNKAASDSGFNYCCDFNGDDRCNLCDFSFVGDHYNDEHPWYQQGSLASVVEISDVTVALRIEQIELPGEKRRLYVTIDLLNAMGVSRVCLGLENKQGDIRYTGWENGVEFQKTVLVSPLERHGGENLFIYAYGGREIDKNRITMGTVEYCASGARERSLSVEDFKLVIGDVMDAKGNIKTIRDVDPRCFVGETPTYDNRLYANVPNPFNPVTKITFSMEEDANVNLSVYNVAGQLIRRLVNGYRLKGLYTEMWDGKDNNGNLVASGIYFYRLKTDSFSSSKKIVLIR